MNRRDFLKTAGVSALGVPLLTRHLLAAQNSSAAPNKPNFLFIITDQQNSTTLSSTGNPHVKTPGEDSIAAKGKRFTKSYCTNPLCSPSRSTLFTSRMAHETGVNTNDPKHASIPAEMPTMGKLFSAAGYETAYAGKWHLPEPYPAFRNKKIPGFQVLGMKGKQAKVGGITSGLTVDKAAADAAVEFLGKPHDKPFLLVCSILNPHDICSYPKVKEFYNKLVPANQALPPTLPNFNALQNEPEELAATRTRKEKGNGVDAWSEEQWRTYRAAYYHLAEVADGHVRQVLAALERGGQASNTIVIYTSDHGEMMGAHKLTFKQWLYEESAAVPLIVSVPGVTSAPSVNTSHLVSGIDILPTMCDYAGIAIPDSFRGKSLRPLVEDKTVAWRDFVISAVAEKEARMLRSAKYKYIVYGSGANPEQLFDMDADPYEMKNLVSDASKKDVLTTHRTMLAQWMKETRDPFAETALGGPRKPASDSDAGGE